MNSVGIDLHRKRSHMAVVSDDGRLLLSRRIDNDPAAFLALLGEIDGESTVALEATYGWEWLAELLEEAGYELHPVHPLRTRAIAAARVKTDAVDARTLAQLLRADLVPEGYVAPRELRDLRDLLRHRVALTQMRSALKNRVHALLAKHGVQHGHGDLFGKGGSEFLAALELREPPRRWLESSLALIRDFDREIKLATGEIDALAKHGDRVEVLCQLRGVGRYTAMLVIAEVGDVSRFGSARKLCAWAGLTPTVRSSDGKAASATSQSKDHDRFAGRSSRPPNTPAAAAARSGTASSGSPSAAGARSPKGAIARKILTLCYYGLRDEEIRCLARAAAGRARQYSWRPRREARRPPDRRGRPRSDADPRASSPYVLASTQHGRPPT
jgi:transposase